MVAVDGGLALAASSMLSKVFTLADLLDISRNLWISTYFTGASGVLLLYDYLLTVPDGTFELMVLAALTKEPEVEHIWGSKLSLPILLFYIVSHAPLNVLSSRRLRTATSRFLFSSWASFVRIQS